MYKLGFIGMGNMAKALAAGFLSSGKIEGKEMAAYAPNKQKLNDNAGKMGFVPKASLKELVEESEIVMMACKPYQIEGVLGEIGELLKGKALVSIAAGWDFSKYEKYLDPSVRLQFVMPNTPAMVGEGVLLFEEKNSLNIEEKEDIQQLFETVGLVRVLPSHLMGIGGALTGCGPAFVDLMIEAYGDAGVKYGIPRPLAYELISQMILGSAALQLKTGEHPGVLKDQVCSPSGTTIRGVNALENQCFRGTCIQSIDAIMNKK